MAMQISSSPEDYIRKALEKVARLRGSGPDSLRSARQNARSPPTDGPATFAPSKAPA
jgi:hypothetical protein